MFRRLLGAIVQNNPGRPPTFLNNPSHATLHATLSSGFPVPLQEDAQNRSHSLQRTRKAFEKNRLKHDHELRKIHVSLLRAPVIHQRTEDHIDQERISQIAADHFARRQGLCRQRDFIEGPYFLNELLKPIYLRRKYPVHFADEERKIVSKAQFATPQKGNLGLLLFAEIQFFSINS